MPFDDLADESEESDPGDEALDELAGTLADDSTAGEESSENDTTSEDRDTVSAYNSQTEPAFPTAKTQTQHIRSTAFLKRGIRLMVHLAFSSKPKLCSVAMAMKLCRNVNCTMHCSNLQHNS